MEQLLIALLKLFVQLVLFAVTGKWHDLNKLGERARQPRPQKKPAVPRKQRPARAARPARVPPSGAPQAEAPWPFEFEDEYVETEPQEEELGGELTRQPTFQRRRPRRVPKAPPAARGPRSIASALRDRQTVREAIVLGAALGRRGPRR